MSLITLSFNVSALSKDALPTFLAHVAKMQMLYEELCVVESHPEAPPAESLPLPEVEMPLELMTNQELRDQLADLTGKPRGRKSTPKFPTKAALIAEIQRLRGLATLPRLVEERDGSLFVSVPSAMSEDSLEKPESAADAASEASSKKPRKSRFDNMTPEEAAAEKAKRKAARDKKKAEKAAGAGSA